MTVFVLSKFMFQDMRVQSLMSPDTVYECNYYIFNNWAASKCTIQTIHSRLIITSTMGLNMFSVLRSYRLFCC